MAMDVQPDGQSQSDSPSPSGGAGTSPLDWIYPAALIILCLLVIVSPLGTWITLGFGHQSHAYTFNYRSGSPGWQYLLLSVATLISITVGLLTHRRDARVIAATIMGAATIAAGTAVVQYMFFSAGAAPESWTIGWGLWLCLASSLVGTVIAVLWVRKSPPETQLQV